MILTELELCNYRKHRKLKLKLKDGVTGIVGDNDTGKSTIIEAILFVLTGELFTGRKDEAITLGEDSGYVLVKFVLNGKTGILQRWLSGSKVELTYDGPKLKKATEVKELWDKLLQVGPEIISKVIIAQQGNIPLLFSGDSSVREKVMQKIFLVPNVERARNIIVKNYLKQLPPLLPIEDTNALEEVIAKLKSDILGLKKEISEIEICSDELVEEYKQALQFLIKCENDAGARIIVQDSMLAQHKKVNEYKGLCEEYKALLSSINIKDYERQKNTLIQQKALYTQRQKLEKQRDELKAKHTSAISIKDLQDKLNTANAEYAEVRMEYTRTGVVLDGINTQIKKLSGLKKESVCFTCGQPLHSITDLLAKLVEEKEPIQNSLSELGNRLTILAAASKEAQHQYDVLREQTESITVVENTLLNFPHIDFNQQDLDTFDELIKTYNEYVALHTEAKLNLEKASNRYLLFKQEFESLAEYTGDNLQRDKEMYAEVLQRNTEAIRLSQSKSSDLRMMEYKLGDLQQRCERSKLNEQKNKKRNKFSEVLNTIVDTFQTSNFPRKLILDYADIVSAHLQEKLQDFNMPYTARVADNFKIEMLDDAGNKLPTVSGGREVQVGIALHIALHELFSQSFPLLIIDEGTTHLDTANRKAYFDIIKKLKEAETLQQIIIIDHDEGLIDVVDHIINLNKLTKDDSDITDTAGSRHTSIADTPRAEKIHKTES